MLVPVRVISEEHGRVRPVGSRPAPGRRALHSADAAADRSPPPPAPRRSTTAPPPPPPPTPNPLTLGGYFRSYYFTRQNASNNPGTQFNFTPGAKYNSNGVNQASWNSAYLSAWSTTIFPAAAWHIGGTYLYANPMDGPCVVPANHAKGARLRNAGSAQHQSRRHATRLYDEHVLRSVPRTYQGDYGWNGDDRQHALQLAVGQSVGFAFETGGVPRRRPRLYDARAAGRSKARTCSTLENRTSSDFNRQTLLTSYPAGGGGLASNIDFPGGQGINTNGFAFGKVGYANPDRASRPTDTSTASAIIVNMWWFDGKYTFIAVRWAPFIALQGGTEENTGQSYHRKDQQPSYRRADRAPT